MRSFLSLSFFRPAKAIFVPGMYYSARMGVSAKAHRPAEGRDRTFLGFSRYSNRVCSSHVTPLFTFAAVYEKLSTWPDLRPKSLHTKKEKRTVSWRLWTGRQREYAPVQVGADLVRLAGADGVALRAPCLEEGRTLGRVTWQPDGKVSAPPRVARQTSITTTHRFGKACLEKK
jgi:hypothetical protein